MRPLDEKNIEESAFLMFFSEPVKPGWLAFVLSLINSLTPFEPYSANFNISNGLPSTGVWSILKSPVWIMVPIPLVMAYPTPSTIECVVLIASSSKSPMTNFLLGSISTVSTSSNLNSLSFALTSPSVNFVAYIGTLTFCKR